MRITGAEDLRIQKTIAAIKSAFEELICEKDYESIRVTELCARARISKKTFYHYYLSLDALLAEMQTELSSGYIEKIRHFHLPDEFEKVNREFFLFSARQGPAYDKITCSGTYSAIRQQMISKVMEATWKQSAQFQSLGPLRQRLLLNFITTVTVGSYREWVASGKQAPMEDVLEWTNALVRGGIDRFFPLAVQGGNHKE